MAIRSLSPKRLAERAQQHRQAVMILARLAAKRIVQDNLRAQGVRVTLFPHAELMRAKLRNISPIIPSFISKH